MLQSFFELVNQIHSMIFFHDYIGLNWPGVGEVGEDSPLVDIFLGVGDYLRNGPVVQ